MPPDMPASGGPTPPTRRTVVTKVFVSLSPERRLWSRVFATPPDGSQELPVKSGIGLSSFALQSTLFPYQQLSDVDVLLLYARSESLGHIWDDEMEI